MTEVFEWVDGDRRWRIPYDEIGEGPALLCLPAPSTISTREEMRGLAERLALRRRVTRIDWPGLGEAERKPVRYRPALLVRFLAGFLERFREPVEVVAAGHAAGFVLEVVREAPGKFARVALLAPTWRGPLPTAMGSHPKLWRALESMVCAPIAGPLLYALNASRPVVHWMMRRHVYADPARITEEVLQHRVRIAHRRNARFAAGAFVTGGLDTFHSREQFLEAAAACAVPLFVAVGDRTPPRSLAEMEALTALPNVQSVTLPGSLALYDERPGETASAVAEFLEGA
jgi:pimeloyl-ACP methyl ester carboxylesterase